MRPCKHSAPISGPITITVTAPVECIFCEVDRLRGALACIRLHLHRYNSDDMDPVTTLENIERDMLDYQK